MKKLPTTPNKAITVLLVVFLLAAFAITLTGCKANKSGLGDKDSSKTESAAEKKAREDLEHARSEAKARLDQAMAAISDLQGMGMDTSDLNEYINTAQFMYVYAETPEEYMGLTDSAAYWANVVINFCQEKKDAYLAALAEEEEDIEANDEVVDVEEEPVDPQPDGDYVKGQLIVKFKQGITEEEVRIVVAKHGCTVQDLWSIPESLYAGVILPEGKDEDEAICEFVLEPSVEYAEKVVYRYES